MKSINQYINESIKDCINIEQIKNECPNFYAAASQFCRDKNSKNGLEYILIAWFGQLDEFDKKYKSNQPFTSSEMHEFEEKYLNDKTDEEIEKYEKQHKV